MSVLFVSGNIYEAVWICAAVLTFQKYKTIVSNQKIKYNYLDFAFDKKQILNNAGDFYCGDNNLLDKKNLDFCAGQKGKKDKYNKYNYLSKVGIYRRLTIPSEFDHYLEMPVFDFNPNDYYVSLKSENFEINLGSLIEWVKFEYPKILNLEVLGKIKDYNCSAIVYLEFCSKCNSAILNYKNKCNKCDLVIQQSSKNILSTIFDLDIQRSSEKILTKTSSELDLLEQQLSERLQGCEIWGDLKLSKDEYEKLKISIAREFGNTPTANTLKRLFNNYPTVIITDIIFFVLNEYQNNNFWDSWPIRYGVELKPVNQSEIGKLILAVFKKYNFSVSDDGGLTYLTPILCQAGIPGVCFDKLFDILDSTLNSPCFIAQELVEELIAYRSYLIDAPVERYFKFHTERALEIVGQIREMMHSFGNLKDSDAEQILEITGIEQRIITQYISWADQIRNLRNKSLSQTKYFYAPKLFYDDSYKRICLLLPEQNIRQDSIYKLKWTIIYNGDSKDSKDYYSQVLNIDGKNCTAEAIVPIDLAEDYTIELRDVDFEKPITSPWKIEGLNDKNCLLKFNENGYLTSQKYISRKGMLIVLDKEDTIISEVHNINKNDIYLPGKWSNLQAIQIYPADKDASISLKTFDDVVKLECKQSFDFELTQKNTLFAEKYGKREMPVYTRFPTLAIDADLESYDISVFNKWQLVIIHRLSNTKHSVMLSDLEFTKDADSTYFDLNNYAQKFFKDFFGAYDLKVYDGQTRRYLSFFFVPYIKYSGFIKDFYTEDFNNNSKSGFLVEKNTKVKIEFEKDVKCIPSETRVGWLEVTTTKKSAYIRGLIVFDFKGLIRKVPFKKTVGALHWSFWDENENNIEEYNKARLFFIEELRKTNWRLMLHFVYGFENYDIIKLVLRTIDNKDLQEKIIEPDINGNCLISLNLFQNTIGDNQLPLRIELIISKDSYEFPPRCIAVIRSLVHLKNPKYRMNKEKPIIYWDKENDLVNKKLVIKSLNEPDFKTLEYSLTERKISKNGEFEGLFIVAPLNDGIYFIDAKEDADFSFFDEEEEQIITIYNSEHILCINGEQAINSLTAQENNLNAKGNFKLCDWLSAAIIAMHKEEWIENFADKFISYIQQNRIQFFNNKCIPLLFTLILNSNDKSNLTEAAKLKIRIIYEMVNNYIVTNENRTEILEFLLKSNIPDTDSITIINELQLYLFNKNESIIFNKSITQKMWELKEPIAILMNLKDCVEDRLVDLDRIVNHLNRDALMKIINFKYEKNCNITDWDYCFEQIIIGNCSCKDVKFDISSKTWGDAKEYSNLFICDRGNWVRQVPEVQHTSGYAFMGKYYLMLIFSLLPCPHEYAIKAQEESHKVESLVSQYRDKNIRLFTILRERLGENPGNEHKLFYSIGCSSVLIALSNHKIIDSNLQELLPFLKYTMRIFPELVYRDLILSELCILFEKGRDI